MKVAILTFQGSNNYGALLQAFALQKKIMDISSVDVEIVNYTSPTKSGWYKPVDFSKKKGIKHNLKQIIKLPNFLFIKKKNHKTDRFKNDKLKIGTEHFIGKSANLENYLNKFSTVIVGSDQVWNYINTSFDKVYLLDFKSNKYKKVSYAASFGRDIIPENMEKQMASLLQDFDMISVRENSGKTIINKMFDKQVYVTLDPTLLLTNKEWHKEFPATTQIQSKKYLLVYTIGRDRELDKIAKNFAKRYHLELVRIMRDFRDNLRFSEIRKNPSVEDFLSLISNAEYVITNSFHGVAFSINFKKDFVVYLNPQNKANTRINNLLEITDLGSRIIHSEDEWKALTSIDYTNKLMNLEIERHKSLKYLKNILGVEEEF